MTDQPPGGGIPKPPQIPGRLNQQAAATVFQRFWKNAPCPFGHTNWIFGRDLVNLAFASYPTVAQGDTLPYPCIVVICKDCGYTMLFNALLLGLAGT